MPRFSVMLGNLLEPEIFLHRWPEGYDCYADPLRLLGSMISRLIETGLRRPGLDSFLANSDDHELCGLDRCDPDYADESSGIYVRAFHREMRRKPISTPVATPIVTPPSSVTMTASQRGRFLRNAKSPRCRP